MTLFNVDKGVITDLSEIIAEQKAQLDDLDKKLAESNDRFSVIFDKNHTLEAKLVELEDQVKEVMPIVRMFQRMVDKEKALKKLIEASSA
ncbi:MAG: hypothetical protein NWE89_05410 [Candidatus Bathyarchaeota archaeon]|nr:hypothetical protein [Candidatus Bathyarchaeota archaeon]